MRFGCCYCYDHYAAESVKQERDSLATNLNEIRHDTSRKMADMQQRFDHMYALMQDCQVSAWAKIACHHIAHSETQLQLYMYLDTVVHLVNGGLPCLPRYSTFIYVTCRCQPEERHLPGLNWTAATALLHADQHSE